MNTMIYAKVITINTPESKAVGQRCVESGKKVGIEVHPYVGFDPINYDVFVQAQRFGIPIEGFNEKWSRLDRCVAAFLSHFSLWVLCADSKEEFLILEHDAVFVNYVPNVQYDGLLSLGAPSYGKFNTPSLIGVNPLTSKPYLPGAHAYLLKPEAAKILIEKASILAKPTDIYLNRTDFPWIQEYYPWPVIAKDSFTTIQNEMGIRAKHNKVDII